MSSKRASGKWMVQDTKRPGDTTILPLTGQERLLEQLMRPTLKDLLLAESPRADIPVPSRKIWKRREPTPIE